MTAVRLKILLPKATRLQADSRAMREAITARPVPVTRQAIVTTWWGLGYIVMGELWK